MLEANDVCLVLSGGNKIIAVLEWDLIGHQYFTKDENDFLTV